MPTPPEPNARPWTEQLLVAGICLPFLVSGADKALDFHAAVEEMVHFALPAPATVAILVIVLQLGGSLLALFATGIPAAAGATALAVFTLAATLLAHAFWNLSGAERAMNMNAFFEHLAIMAGLLYVASRRLQEVRATPDVLWSLE